MTIGVTDWVWNYSRSRHGARLVLLAIAGHGEAATISVARLAYMAGLAERATQMAVHELIELGELAVEPNAGERGWNRYSVLMSHMDRLTMPTSAPRDEVPAETRFFVFERDGYRLRYFLFVTHQSRPF